MAVDDENSRYIDTVGYYAYFILAVTAHSTTQKKEFKAS